MPEANLVRVRQRLSSGQLKVLAIPRDNRTFGEGPVETFIGSGVDITTGTLKLKGAFQNGNGRLWPAEIVDVALVLSTKKNVVVPTKAIQTGQ